MQHPPKKQIKRKSIVLPAALTAGMLLLAAAFVLLLPAIRQAFPAQTLEYELKQNTVRTIGERDQAQIDTITLYPDGQNGYTLYMQQGRLMLENNEQRYAISEAYQAQILDVLTEVTVQNTVSENATELQHELEHMGLLAPQHKAVIRYLDGSVETMEVGLMPHGSSEYYFRWSGAPGIYLCDSGVPETLSLQPELLLPFEQISMTAALVEDVRIQNANGECAIAFANSNDAEVTIPKRYPADGEAAQNLLTAVDSFRLGSYEAPLTDENKAAYGFDAPLCTLNIRQRGGMINVITEEGSLAVEEQPPKTYELILGREEGAFFYTCAYQDQVYLVSRFLVEAFVQANWQNIVTRRPAAVENALLSDIVFEMPGKTVEVHVERTESVLENNQLEVDDEGKPVYLTHVTVNGQEAPQEMLDVLLDSLNALTVEGNIPENAAVEAEPRWRITLVAEDGGIRVLEGHRLDIFSDAVAVNGTMCHYVYDEAIDVLMSGME